MEVNTAGVEADTRQVVSLEPLCAYEATSVHVAGARGLVGLRRRDSIFFESVADGDHCHQRTKIGAANYRDHFPAGPAQTLKRQFQRLVLVHVWKYPLAHNLA